MAYGKIKVDTLTWDDSGTDTDIVIGTIPTGASPTFTGNVTINAQGDIRLADADSTHYVGFQSPASVTSNIVWTLPSADAGSSGDALVSDGSGNLSFTTIAATPSGSNTQVQFNNSGAFGGSSSLTFNDSTDVLTATNVHDSAGDVRKVPFGQAYSSGTPSLAIADANRYVETTVALTVPQGVFSKGHVITIINTHNAAIQITQGGNVTMTWANDGTTGDKSLAVGGQATILYRTDSGTTPALCTISGAGLS